MDDKSKTFAPDLAIAKAYLKKDLTLTKSMAWQMQKGRCKHGVCDTIVGYERQGVSPNAAEDILIGAVHICPDCAALQADILPAGRVTLIVGPQASGKTFIANALAVADPDAVIIDGLTGAELEGAIKAVPRYRSVIVCILEDGGEISHDRQFAIKLAESRGCECRTLTLDFYDL